MRRATLQTTLAVLPPLLLIWLAVLAAEKDMLAVDFRASLYPQGQLLVQGDSPFASPDVDLSPGYGNVFPVPAAALAAPFTALSSSHAAIAFSLFLLLALGATLAALGVRDWRVYAVVLLWPATISALQTGNLTIVLALLIALAWRWRDRRIAPGLAVGAAVAIKIFPWPLIIWLLVTRRFAAAATASAVAGLGVLTALPFIGLREYIALMRNLGDTFRDHGYTVYGLLVQGGAPSQIATAVALFVFLAVLVAAVRSGSFPLFLAACLLVSPIVWLHYYFILAIPLAVRYPRLAWAWALPLVAWLCPGSGEYVEAWHTAIMLALLGSVIGVVSYVRRERVGEAVPVG